MIILSRGVLLVGVILVVLSAFGIQLGPADTFRIGVAMCFAAGLVP